MPQFPHGHRGDTKSICHGVIARLKSVWVETQGPVTGSPRGPLTCGVGGRGSGGPRGAGMQLEATVWPQRSPRTAPDPWPAHPEPQAWRRLPAGSTSNPLGLWARKGPPRASGPSRPDQARCLASGALSVALTGRLQPRVGTHRGRAPPRPDLLWMEPECEGAGRLSAEPARCSLAHPLTQAARAAAAPRALGGARPRPPRADLRQDWGAGGGVGGAALRLRPRVLARGVRSPSRGGGGGAARSQGVGLLDGLVRAARRSSDPCCLRGWELRTRPRPRPAQGPRNAALPGSLRAAPVLTAETWLCPPPDPSRAVATYPNLLDCYTKF